MKWVFNGTVWLIWVFCVMLSAGCGSSVSEKTQAAQTGAVSYPNGALLVSTSELAATINDANQVIIDVRSVGAYNTSHINNAVNLPPGTFDIGGPGIDSMDLRTPADIANILGAAGVSNSKKIIVYGAGVDANAGRVFWMLEYLGATDVHILDGGYSKWVSDVRATVTTPTVVTPATFTPAVNSSRLATKASVYANYANAAYVIIDSRNVADYTAITGHIPNAINILIDAFLNADGTVKSYTDLKTFLDGMGVTTGKTVITYCYVGYRSGQEYFILRLMGFNVSNYDGSYTEWSADPAMPIAH